MRERGQATVEWLALVLLVVALLGAGAAVVHPARALRAALPRDPPDPLAAAYGSRLAALVRRQAPNLVYARGLRQVPVDPRECRVPACARGAAPVLFTHVVRNGDSVYIQYWEYFPDSVWNGIAGRHADDWESYQVRIDVSGRVRVRASAHHGYTGRRIGRDLNLNQVDPGLVGVEAWTAPTGWLRIARGSHAGYIARGPYGRRTTPADQIALIPLETTALPERYAITPPWRKRVYTDAGSPAT